MKSSDTMRSNTDFLSEGNLCGQALIRLVCRGDAIISGMLVLSGRIPEPFSSAAAEAEAGKTGTPAANSSSYLKGLFGGGGQKGDPSSAVEAKYNSLLFDFMYLRNPEEYESKVDAEGSSGMDVRALENEFSSIHQKSLAQFYHLFESIFLYQSDLNKFVTELSAGYYIQYTVESVLLDVNGKQLLCEAAYLYGMMLIIMERLIQGPVRERIVIAFFRYCGKDGNLSRFDDVCQLVRSTGRPYSRLHDSYDTLCEEKLFPRFPLPAGLIRSLIGCLLTDDIYASNELFPRFEHRTTRLGKQAGILYVLLYFQPTILSDELGTMRLIADRFFHDNWAVSLYGGMTVDISEQWSRFEAAAVALENWQRLPYMEQLYSSNAKISDQCCSDLRKHLVSGVLTDDFVLNNLDELLDCMRQCNVALRWQILHRQVMSTKIMRGKTEHKNPAADQGSNMSMTDAKVLHMMLLTSRFEEKLKSCVQSLLKRKGEIWRTRQADARKIMVELSAYFTGEQALTDVARNEPLVKWFAGMANEIENLSLAKHLTVTGKDIQLCIQALIDIEQFDLIDRSDQLKASLKIARDQLLQMIRAITITDDVVRVLVRVSDMSYAQEAIGSYVSVIHTSVNKDPPTVELLRGLFLKLTSCLDVGTFRLRQGCSAELGEVETYYSSFLVELIKGILDVIPVSVFSLLLQIAGVKQRRLQDVPVKIDIEALRTHAQLEERYKLSLLTYELSVFTEGILAMETITVGNDQISPCHLLTAGIRKELVQHVSAVLHRTLQFHFKGDIKPSSIVDFLGGSTKSFRFVERHLNSLKQALEHIQDYIGVSGLKIWGEEFSRVVAFSVEQESNKYLREKVSGSESSYQLSYAPIPLFSPTETEPLYMNFMGRTMSCLLKITEPQVTVFSLECNGWFVPDGTEVCGSRLFAVVRSALGTFGLAGLDRLLSFRVLNEMQRFIKYYKSAVKSHGVLLEQIRDGLFPEWKTHHDAMKFYASATKKTEKLMVPVVTCLRRVGQAQLIRKMIRNELQACAQASSRQLLLSLSEVNSMLMTEVFDGKKESISKSNCISLQHLSDKLDMVGDVDPLSTMFLAVDPLEGLPLVLSIFVISHVDKFNYDMDFGSLVRSKEEYPFDGWPIVAGMATILKQFHSSFMKSLFSYLAQYFRSGVDGSYLIKKVSKKDDQSVIPQNLKNTVIFLKQLCSISGISVALLHEYLPQSLIEICTT